MNIPSRDIPARSPRRLFVERGSLPPEQGELLLTGEPKRHVHDVLRMVPGDMLVLFDGSGWEYPATVIESNQKHVRLRILKPQRGEGEPPIDIHLGIGLLKAQKMDLVIQKSVELGVGSVWPLVTRRAVPALDPRRARERTGRWQKIAQEASRQCGRPQVPQIHPVAPLDNILEQAESCDLGLLFCTQEGDGLKNVPQSRHPHPGRIFILVGPEGGFAMEEEQMATAKGFIPVGLGPRILRAETAAILAVGLVQYRLGDLGGIEKKEAKQ